MRILSRLGRGIKSAAAASYVIITNGVDVLLLSAANTVRNATDIVLSTQHLDETGAPLKSLSSLAQGGFVRLSNGTIEALLSAANIPRANTDIVLSTQPLDAQGNVITGGGGTSGGLTLYSTAAGHFTAVWVDDENLDISGHPSITDFASFVEIEAFTAGGAFIAKYTPKSHDFAWDPATGRVTVTGALFVTGGTHRISVLAADRYSNQPGDFLKTAEVNPYLARGDSAGSDLLSAAPQAFTDSMADAGTEVNMIGRGGLLYYTVIDIGDDTGMQFQALAKHEPNGAQEYKLPLKAVGASLVMVEDLVYQLTDDVDQLICIEVVTNGRIPSVQLQIARAVNGGGVDAELDGLHVVRSMYGGGQ